MSHHEKGKTTDMKSDMGKTDKGAAKGGSKSTPKK